MELFSFRSQTCITPNKCIVHHTSQFYRLSELVGCFVIVNSWMIIMHQFFHSPGNCNNTSGCIKRYQYHAAHKVFLFLYIFWKKYCSWPTTVTSFLFYKIYLKVVIVFKKELYLIFFKMAFTIFATEFILVHFIYIFISKEEISNLCYLVSVYIQVLV